MLFQASADKICDDRADYSLTYYENISIDVFKEVYVKFSNLQKQPSRGVRKKSCSGNTPQIYRRTPIPKCDFNKVAK